MGKDLKHTKGNWLIKQTKLENTDTVCQTVLMTDLKYKNTEKSPVICDLYGQFTEEGRANAKLLRSAPEMLKMLLELQECAEYWSEYDVPIGIKERLDKVIYKATE